MSVAQTESTALRSAPTAAPPDPADVLAGWALPGGPGDIGAQTAGWGAAEWARARKAALVHGVAPLLAWRLSATPAWPALDQGLRDYCAGQLALNEARVALILAELGEIREAAAAAGVTVLALKGAALAARYYPAPALRPMADLDLLVRPAEAAGLHAALTRLGYQVAEETPRHRAYARGEQRVASYDGEHPDNPRGVEVHTVVEERLRGMRHAITGALWAGAEDGAPGPAGLLQHLLIHTCHNIVGRRLRLIQLQDIALVAPRVTAAEWLAAAEAAARAGEARLLFAPLALAERLYGPLAPTAARELLARGTPAALRRLIERATPAELSLCSPGESSPGYKLAWYRPGRERLAAAAQVLLPEPAELRQRYPQLAGRPAAAYLRHAGHVAAWAVRLLLRAPRRLAGGEG